MKAAAAFIGPTVCDDDGPIPILKRSKTLITTSAGTLLEAHYPGDGRLNSLSCGMISLAMISIWLISYL